MALFTEVCYLHALLLTWLLCWQSFNIVDIKPTNMEELTEVITAAEFHPHNCNVFVYSSSKGTIRLCDMRQAALCDSHSKCEYYLVNMHDFKWSGKIILYQTQVLIPKIWDSSFDCL